MSETTSLRANGYALVRDLSPKLVAVGDLKLLGRETRKHSAEQVRKLARSLDRFGFVLPIVIDGKNRVVAGWGLVLAARRLELPEVPAVTVTNVSEAELRALRLCLNKLNEESEWDRAALALEFKDILSLDTNIELEISGFDMGEIDLVLSGTGTEEEDDAVTEFDKDSVPVAKPGDLWCLGEHRIFCGDALKPESYQELLGDLSPIFHPAEGRVRSSFEPLRLGGATGRGAEPSGSSSVPPRCMPGALSFA